jgi:hypothetical protein
MTDITFPRIIVCSHSMHSWRKLGKYEEVDIMSLSAFYGLQAHQNRLTEVRQTIKKLVFRII